MANYRKSFNLRNGVQVDDDNFIVNANGLVGVGTSVPTEFLDVRGNAKVVGLVTANTLYAGIATVGSLTSQQGLSVSGVVTATSFSGDGSALTGIYAVAVDGWYLSSGSISTTSNVGVGITNPQGTLQVGTGVIINSDGNATYSGLITATAFNGDGSNITSINASNISSGTLSNPRLPSDISIAGILTSSRVVTGSINVSPGGANVAGVVTATGGLIGNVTGNVIGNVTGNVTGNVVGDLVGNVTGTASTAQSLTGTPNITVGVVTASSVGTGIVTAGIATIFTELDVGIGGTAFSALNSGRIGIGTALPTSDLQIIKSSSSLLEVISNTGSTRISVGQSVGVGKSTGVLRFGNIDRTFDIINNDVGNLNYYLHAGAAGVGTGRFEWIYGQTNAQLMSLTYGGSLGLGKTNPDNTLHVVGTSTVTGNAWFGNNVTIKGTLSATTLNLPAFTGQLIGNVYASSGVSTFSRLETTSNITVSTGSSIGIGTTRPISGLDLRAGTGLFGNLGIATDAVGDGNAFNIGGVAVIPGGSIGIGTTALLTTPPFGQVQIFNNIVDLYGGKLNVKTNSSVGFNTYTPRAIFDFGNVGSATTRPVMVVPNISSSTINGIGQTPTGAMIFNTDTSTFQGYTGTAWVDFH